MQLSDISSDAEAALTVLRAEAVDMAGGLGDLAQRASVYRRVYSHSGGAHGFPLLAAHGALWAGGYFRMGMRFGACAAALRGLAGEDSRLLTARLKAFADAFRDINRLVCVETWFVYRLTADPRFAAAAERRTPPELLEEMLRLHAARRAGRSLTEAERRGLFRAFFLWEQKTLVGPGVERAFQEFDWPLIRRMALKPKIRFAYFPRLDPLVFRNFADREERVELGLIAFDRACRLGWPKVDQALERYGPPLTFQPASLDAPLAI